MTVIELFQLPNDHCDDYIRDKAQPKCLRLFLLYKRIPALWALKWSAKGWPTPKLFASIVGDPVRYRVVMASRLGDVGITADLNADSGYSRRVTLDQLTDFRDDG